MPEEDNGEWPEDYHLINLWLTLQFLIEAETYSFQSLNHKVISTGFLLGLIFKELEVLFTTHTYTHIFSSFTLNMVS